MGEDLFFLFQFAQLKGNVAFVLAEIRVQKYSLLVLGVVVAGVQDVLRSNQKCKLVTGGEIESWSRIQVGGFTLTTKIVTKRILVQRH